MTDTSTQLLPLAFAADSLEGLAAEHGRQRPWIYWLVLLGIAGAFGCLPFVEINVSVRAPGIIRPATERAEVRPSVSGHVARVLAHDNDLVEAGQPLLVLASPDLDEQLHRNRERQNEHINLIHDLERLTARTIDRVDGNGTLSALSPLKSLAGFTSPALGREHAQLLARLASNQLDETKARTELERFSTLAAQGIASRRDLDRARYEVERLRAEALVIAREFLARWQERLREEETALADLQSEEKRLAGDVARFTIRAPVKGMLIGFTGWSAGGFISNGQVLGAVSPSDTLLVETIVSPRDVGLIAVGQAAKIQVDAFPYTQWGMLAGTVAAVSGDSIGSSAAGPAVSPWFKVIVHPAANELRLSSGARGILRKGLTVQCRYLVARRSLLQLLYGTAGSWLNPQESLRTFAPGMTPGVQTQE